MSYVPLEEPTCSILRGYTEIPPPTPQRQNVTVFYYFYKIIIVMSQAIFKETPEQITVTNADDLNKTTHYFCNMAKFNGLMPLRWFLPILTL